MTMDQQVQVTVSIEISGRNLPGEVIVARISSRQSKSAATVVAENTNPRARRGPRVDNQIQITIAVHIAGEHLRWCGRHGNGVGDSEVPTTVIQQNRDVAASAAGG